MYLLCSFYLPWHFYSLRFYTCQEVLFADCRTSWNSEFHPQSLCYILPPTNTRFTRVCKQFVIAGSFVHNLPGNCLRGQQVCTQFLLLLCQNKQLLDVCHNFIALTVHLQSCIFCLALNLTMIAIQSICSSEIPLESCGKFWQKSWDCERTTLLIGTNSQIFRASQFGNFTWLENLTRPKSRIRISVGS